MLNKKNTVLINTILYFLLIIYAWQNIRYLICLSAINYTCKKSCLRHLVFFYEFIFHVGSVNIICFTMAFLSLSCSSLRKCFNPISYDSSKITAFADRIPWTQQQADLCWTFTLGKLGSLLCQHYDTIATLNFNLYVSNKKQTNFMLCM